MEGHAARLLVLEKVCSPPKRQQPSKRLIGRPQAAALKKAHWSEYNLVVGGQAEGVPG